MCFFLFFLFSRSPIVIFVFLQWHHIHTVCSRSRAIKLILHHRHIRALHAFWILRSNLLHIQRNRLIFQRSRVRYDPIILSLTLSAFSDISYSLHSHSKPLWYAHYYFRPFYHTHLNESNCIVWIIRSRWTRSTIFLRSIRPHWINRRLRYRQHELRYHQWKKYRLHSRIWWYHPWIA